jgi:hypothetical protein
VSTQPAPETSLTLEADAEIASARQVLRELDKSWRATRTYGLTNSATRRFFEQLHALMLAHLEAFTVLGVVVDRTELRMHGEVVYSSEDSLGESLAFRLYGDGVREVRFEQGLGPEDLDGFLDALWVRDDGSDADDDVVTRLWTKDLATISFVTAEDIVQAPLSADLVPQEHGFFAAPPMSFGGVLEREKGLQRRADTASGEGPAAAGENLGRSGLVGFEVSDADRAQLEREIAEERGIETRGKVLAMLEAILASEPSSLVLTKALGEVPAVLDALLDGGHWSALVGVFSMLETAPGENPACGLTERLLAQRVLDSFNLPERVARIATGLNLAPPQPMTGLSGVFARLSPAAVGPLCGVLASLSNEEHRAALRDTLIRLGAENPEPVLKGLADPRPGYVLDLMAVIVAWQQPQAADVLSMLSHHAAPEVREEALSCIARLHGRGDGAPVVAFAGDANREVRLHALRLLATGRYQLTWDRWRGQLPEAESILERPRAEKRALFHALRLTAGDGAVPLWAEFLGKRTWKQRQLREETALLAVRELAALGTPRAREALEAGWRDSAGPVRKACAAALEGKD